MFKIGKKPLIILLFLFIFLLPGCTLMQPKKKTPPPPQNGPFGVYRSNDGGEAWVTKNEVYSVGEARKNLNGVALLKIVKTPVYKNALSILYALADKGLYYSYDKGDSWYQDRLFKTNVVNDIAPSYHNECIVYVAVGQSIWKTEDCMLVWKEIYFNRLEPDLQITQVETDHYNPNVVYAANSNGDVLKSVNGGQEWQTIERLGSYVRQLVMDKYDSRIIYVRSDKKGLVKTTDGGETWSHNSEETDINAKLKGFKGSNEGYRFVQDRSARDTFIYASKFGLLRTTDGGMTWQKIELINPEKAEEIVSLDVDPGNGDQIFYGTANTLYKTRDGGKTWSTQNSPSKARIHFILFDEENSDIVYLGT